MYLCAHHNLTPSSACTSIKKTLFSLPRCRKLPDQKLIIYYLPFLQSSSWEDCFRFYSAAEKSWQVLTSLSVVAEGCSRREGRWRVREEHCCVLVGSHYSNRRGGQPSAARHREGPGGKREVRNHITFPLPRRDTKNPKPAYFKRQAGE